MDQRDQTEELQTVVVPCLDNLVVVALANCARIEVSIPLSALHF